MHVVKLFCNTQERLLGCKIFAIVMESWLLFKMTFSPLKKSEANLLTFTIFQSGHNIMNFQSMKKTFLALKE